MAAKVLSGVYLIAAFVIGAAATIDFRITLAAIAMCAFVVVVRTRFRPLSMQSAMVRINTRPDWIIVILLTATTLRPFNARATVLIVAGLVVAAFMRKSPNRFELRPAPLALIFVSSLIVLSRPANVAQSVILLLVGLLVVRLVMTVDARTIFTSMVDSCGLYLIANVACNAAGLQSPVGNDRIGGIVESSGFVRTIYPLTSSTNIAPIIAAVYVATFIFVFRDTGFVRRLLRIACLAAAVVILVGAGTRTPMGIAVALSICVICFPHATRWLGQASVALAAVSAFVLPQLIESIKFLIAPLLLLSPGRGAQSESLGSLNGRDTIWAHSIKYWSDSVNDFLPMIFGYGVNGQASSGASLEYSRQFEGILRYPELASVHNSFLQQLFDGGIVGWSLLIAAVYWSAVRISRRRTEPGHWSDGAIVALAVLMLGGMTEVSAVPGPGQEGFLLLLFVVGIASQADKSPSSQGSGSVPADEAAEQRVRGPRLPSARA